MILDISKLASARWKECDPKEKEKLFEMYRKDYETYKENMLQYEKLLSKEQKNQIKDVKENYKVHRENQILKKDVRRKLKELNKPRRPAAAFFLYIREMQKRESETHKDFIARMSKEWENLPISSKKKFIEEWEMKTKEYNKELLEWEEEMIQKGNVDVVRSTTLKSKMEASN